MSKEEILKIQKYVLKVSIHCDGCKQKVKKILKKIDGVFITEIDAEQGMVTVYGIVDPNVVIKRLAKSGKPAEIWSNPKVNNNINQNNIANLMKNMQIDNNTPNNRGQMGPQNNQNQPKGSGGGQHQQGQNPQHQQLQQQQQQQQQQLQQHLQQLQQMKGSGDLKVPQFKDTNMSIKMPPNQNPNMKDVNISLPEDDDFDDDEMMDFDDDEYSDDVSDDVMDNPQHPLNKMKLPIGANGPAHMMINGGNLMNAQKGGENGGGNGKKSGGGGLGAVQVHGLGGGSDSKNVEKKGCGGGGNDYGQIQEGGMPEGKNGNKNVSGGTSGGGGGGGAEIPNNNGDTKVNKMSESSIQDMMNNEFPNIGSQGHHPINMSGMPMGGNMSMMNKMGGNMSAVQGHFAGAVTGSGGSGVVAGGYGGPKMMMGGNPYQQQPYIAAMMNQQRGMPIGERFQPMMYAKPPMATNYMYPPPYNYPPPSQYPQDSYSNFFNDENTSSCNIM